MDWPALYEGMRAWFALRSGIVIDDVIWAGEPEGMRGDPSAYLKFLAHGGAGTTDEVVYDAQGTGLDALVGVRGDRTLTLSCRVQSREQSPTGRAFVALERVRNALQLPSSQDTFRALGVGLIGTAVLVDLGRVWDKREESHAVLDIRLTAAVDTLSDTDDALQDTVGTIEHVIVSGTVNPPAISIPPQLIS